MSGEGTLRGGGARHKGGAFSRLRREAFAYSWAGMVLGGPGRGVFGSGDLEEVSGERWAFGGLGVFRDSGLV